MTFRDQRSIQEFKGTTSNLTKIL